MHSHSHKPRACFLLPGFLLFSLIFVTLGQSNGGAIEEVVNNESETESLVQKTLHLLEEGESYIQLSNSTDIILVVGNTGAGKSTLVQFLAGNNSQLESYKKGRLYLIRDNQDRISTKTIASKSIFPELVTYNGESGSRLSFYDCPGFSDTRNQEPYIEIGNAFFIKKVADHGQRIKLVLVANHFSMQPDADRNDFLSLLKSIAVLVKDVSKFRNGVALIASKVRGEEEDEEMIQDIASFMQEVRSDLPKILTNDTLKSAMELLDSLLLHDDGSYPRIAVFRAPRSIGPLSDQPRMQTNRHALMQIIQNIEYVPKSASDFGYALSPTATLLIRDLVSQINRNVTATVSALSVVVLDALKRDFRNALNVRGYDEEESRLEGKLRTASAPIVFLEQNLTSPQVALREIVAKVRQLSPGDQAENIEKSLEILLRQSSYLLFFETARVSPLDADLGHWGLPLAQFKLQIHRFLAGDFTHSLHVALLETLSSYSSSLTQSYLTGGVVEIDVGARVRLIRSDINNLQLVRRNLSIMFNGVDGNSINSTFRLVDFIPEFVTGFRLGGVQNSQRWHGAASALKDIRELMKLDCLVSQAVETKPVDSLRWFLILDNVIGVLQNERQWLEFLIDLQQELSEPNVQVHDEFSWKGMSTDKILGNPALFWSEFSKLNRIVSKYSEPMAPLLVNGSQKMETLVSLLRTTLQRQPCPDAINGVLTVHGTNVVLNEALKCFRNSSNQPKTLVLLAAHTVFIDTDIVGTQLNPSAEGLQVLIIAPTWKILAGDYTFNLDGKPGADRALFTSTASYHGQSGTGGGAGGNGGLFYGIGGKIYGPGRLAISANGGRGGAGQRGQNGGSGRDGRNARIIGISTNGKWLEAAACWGNERVRYDHSLYGHEPMGSGNYVHWWRLKGEMGTSGYTGGNGGPGGGGGQPGMIQFNSLGAEHEPIRFKAGAQASGTEGTHGAGGSGGRHGKQGDSLILHVHPSYCVFEYCCSYRHDRTESHSSPGYARVGSSGLSQKDRQLQPSSFNTSAVATFARTVCTYLNAYKEFGRAQLGNRWLRKANLELLLKIEESTADLYDIYGLTEEFVGLEQQKQRVTSANLLPFFESLLKRVEVAAVKTDVTPGTRPDMLKGYSVLYGAVLSTVCSIKAPLESYLVVDMTKYLDEAKATSAKFKTALNNQQRLAIVQAQADAYNAQVNEKVAEAQELVEVVIKPEFRRIHERIEANTERLIDEIIQLKEQKIHETEKLLRKRAQLEHQMRMSALFGFLQMGVSLLSFGGPLGAAAGSILSNGVGIAEQLATSTGTSTAQKLTALPASVLNAQRTVSAEYAKYTETKLTRYRTQIDDIKQLLQSEEAILHAVTQPVATKLEEIGKKIDLLTGQANSTNSGQFAVQSLTSKLSADLLATQGKQELETALRVSEKKLAAQKNRTDSVNKFLGHLGRATRVASIGVDMYAKYRGQHDQIQEITQQIEQSKREAERIDSHKNKVQNLMIPVIENIGKELENWQMSLSNRSSVSLQVGRWEISKLLKVIRDAISTEFSAGFHVDGDMRRCFEALEDATTILTNVFDRIQTYGEQTALVKLITAVGSAQFESIVVADPKLKIMIQKMEVATSANLLIQQYQAAMNSFSLWVFPYADLFLGDLRPNQLTEDSQPLETTAILAVSNIEKMASRLAVYKSGIVNHDQVLHYRHFNGNSTGSFCEWSHKEYEREIRRILIGGKVAIKARLDCSPTGMDAIKFNQIQLDFKVRSEGGGDGSVGVALRQELSKFKIQLSHSGISEYRHKTRIVSIMSKRINFTFSYSLTPFGLPIDRNAAYDKLMGGDVMLSPYTLWEIQLVPILSSLKADEISDFESLKALIDGRKHKIDMQLNGHGTYIQD